MDIGSAVGRFGNPQGVGSRWLRNTPVVVAFLERFGGLHLFYGNFKDPTVPDYSHFDALRAADGVFPARLKRLGIEGRRADDADWGV